MNTQPMNLITPVGTVVVATLEVLSGRARIVPGSARPDGIGGFEFAYEGTTEILWDEQHTAIREDERVFLDEDNNPYLEGELRLAPHDSEPVEAGKVITVRVEGGVIHGIEGIPRGTTVRIIDFDIEGADAEAITTLENGEQAYVTQWRGEEPP